MNGMRRKFLAIATAVAAFRLDAPAQPGRNGRVVKIGYLTSVGVNPNHPNILAFKDELRRLGWTEGRNFVFEQRRALGDRSKLDALARELATFDPDLVVTPTQFEAVFAARALPNRPIVMCGGFDPVGAGLAQSLARPGGQVTGFTYEQDVRMIQRYLQFAKDYVPELKRVGLLVEPLPGIDDAIEVHRLAADKMGVAVSVQRVSRAEELEGAFAAFARDGVQVLGPFFTSLLITEAARVVALTQRYGWPDIGSNVDEVEMGGFLAYAANREDLFRRAARYADRILKGEKPGDLPIQQPERYDLVINLKTAKALGRPVPQSLLIQATRLIE